MTPPEMPPIVPMRPEDTVTVYVDPVTGDWYHRQGESKQNRQNPGDPAYTDPGVKGGGSQGIVSRTPPIVPGAPSGEAGAKAKQGGKSGYVSVDMQGKQTTGRPAAKPQVESGSFGVSIPKKPATQPSKLKVKGKKGGGPRGRGPSGISPVGK